MGKDEDLAALLKRYVRQETVDPLRSMGRTLLFGLLGSVLLAAGAVLLAGGALRLLQRQEELHAGWSFAPYLAVAVALVAACSVALWRIRRVPDGR